MQKNIWQSGLTIKNIFFLNVSTLHPTPRQLQEDVATLQGISGHIRRPTNNFPNKQLGNFVFENYLWERTYDASNLA